MAPNTVAAVVFSCAFLTLASCAPTSPGAAGAGRGAPAVETQDDDDVGSDPGIGSDVGGNPNWSWSPPADVAVPDPGPDPDPDPGSGADPMGGYSPPLSPVGGYRSPPSHHVAILWVGAPYGPEDFPFKVERNWDKKDGAGGWQTADKLFVFIVRDVETRQVTAGWTCPVTVGMAVQSETKLKISPEKAASVTAEVANIAVPAVAHSRVDWTGLSAVFCNTLQDKMRVVFGGKELKGYGARVCRWNK